MTHNKNNEITTKQQKFVNGVASGDSATTAYVNVYDCKRESAASGSEPAQEYAQYQGGA